MLTINLLPEHVRKGAVSPIEQFHRTPLMWIAAGLMVVYALSLVVRIGLGRQRLHQLEAKIEVLQPKKAQVDQIQQLLARLRAQEAAFRGLKKGQGLWAKGLNVLSDVTPEGVWFTELTLNIPTRGLVIQGSAIEQGGSEMVQVGRLVQDLKTNPGFAFAVKDIQIESIRRLQDREIEIVQFTLACTLAETPATGGTHP